MVFVDQERPFIGLVFTVILKNGKNFDGLGKLARKRREKLKTKTQSNKYK